MVAAQTGPSVRVDPATPARMNPGPASPMTNPSYHFMVLIRPT